MRRRAVRLGFTLVELLVVIGVVALLLAMLLPALNSVRESARSSTCQNNLRQVGIALNNYVAAFDRFPSGAESRASEDYPDHPHTFYRWSALTHLLPHLERSTEYDAVDTTLPMYGPGLAVLPENRLGVAQMISTFLCPSDHGQRVAQGFGPTNYAFCSGTGVSGGTPFETDGVFYVNSRLGPRHVIDGLSHTIALSESTLGHSPGAPAVTMIDPRRDYVFTFATPLTDSACTASTVKNFTDPRGFSWASGEYRCGLYNHHLTPNSHMADCMASITFGELDKRYAAYGWRAARSNHPGRVHGAMLDASVHTFSDDIDEQVWRAHATRDGKD